MKLKKNVIKNNIFIIELVDGKITFCFRMSLNGKW